MGAGQGAGGSARRVCGARLGGWPFPKLIEVDSPQQKGNVDSVLKNMYNELARKLFFLPVC